ncbi:MAG: spore coat protein [Agathobacter sp.]|nr:spore coat protein [Agathobacter sp.]
MPQIYTEKEILGDALSAQKATTGHFNTYANECVHEDLRETLLDILDEEHELQQNLFCMMHDRGLYPTPTADEKKVQQLKSQYAQCVKN